jgi:hypothetical protein
MDGNGGKDRRALGRIVALLFAFAALADRAGTRPQPIRVAVLWLLRAAEGVARDFVIATARENGVDGDLAALPYAHDIADDAGRLARSFTALAELLAHLARRGPPPLSLGRIDDLVDRLKRTFRTLADAPRMMEPAPPDTS